VVNTGTVSATDPDMAGWFYATNATSGIALYAVNPNAYTLANWPNYPVTQNPPNFNEGLAGYFEGNAVVQNALSANSVWTDYLSATYADVDIINVQISELSGYTISGGYFELKPEGFNCSGDIGIAPYESLVLNGVALSGNTWAAFNGDIITHRDAYVKDRLITNNISGCHDGEIDVWSDVHFTEDIRVDGNLYLSGDGHGRQNLYLGGSAHIVGDLDVDGLVLNPTATNIWVNGTTYTDCILPYPNDQYITIGCPDCLNTDLWSYDSNMDFGVRVCGDLSANRIFGLFNTANTELLLSSEECFTTPTWNEELWSHQSIAGPLSSTFDGLVMITTEADEVSGYAQVECFTDGVWVGKMVVGNPGNITNSNISHPLSAERILENKQVITFPIIAQKPWNINLVESYGRTCHNIRVYRHVRSVNMTELIINENLYVGGSSIFVQEVQFQSTIDLDCNSAINVGSITMCPNGNGIEMSCTPILSAEYITFCNGSSFTPGSGLDLNCTPLRNLRYIENDHSTCVDLITSNTNMFFDTTGALVLPRGGTVIDNPNYEQIGAIRYNDDINSFEGYIGSTWTGLGGVTLLETNGTAIAGTAKAYSSTHEPNLTSLGVYMSAGDIWFDTTANVIKRYNGGSWVIFGAAYL